MFDQLEKYKTPIYFLSSTLFSSFFGLLGGVLTYKFINPEELGIWVSLTTFSVYSSFLRLGIPNGMNRELPFYLGKRDNEKAFSYASTTLAFSIWLTIVLFFVLLILLLILYQNANNANIFKAFLVFIVLVVSEPYTTYLSGTFRTSANFRRLSDIQIIMTIIKLLTLYFVYLWGFGGYLLRELLFCLGNIILLHIWRPLPLIKPIFNLGVFKELFNIGFRIFIGSYAFTFINTIPRLFLIKLGTAKELGLFSPIVLSIATIGLIPTTLNSYLYPHYSFKLGESSDRYSFWKEFRYLYILSLAISLPVSILVYFSIDKIFILFPKYIDSIEYIKLSCFLFLFIGFNLGGVLLVVFKEWKSYTKLILLYGLVQIISLFIFKILIHDNLKVVVLAMTVTYFLMFTYTFYLLYRITHK